MMFEKKRLPLLALRDTVLFPGTIAPVFIGREKSIKALFATKMIEDGSYILLSTQKDSSEYEPKISNLYQIGVLAKIIQTVTLPNNNAKILVEIIDRVLLEINDNNKFLEADYSILLDIENTDKSVLDHEISRVIELFSDYIKHKKINSEILVLISEQKNISNIINIVASHLNSDLSLKQSLLEETNVFQRIELLIKLLSNAKVQLETDLDVQERLRKQVEHAQKIYYLQEQLKAIQKELYGEDERSEFFDIENKIKTLKLSDEAYEKAETELKKLKSMSAMSAESSVIRNYLDVLLNLPWGNCDKVKFNINYAENILNKNHFGLLKIKERILEYIAVLQKIKNIKNPILCFIGPPGVGKTSLVKSIANAIGRKYIKLSLGGVRDEAEIRGHRRTYIGAMPGRIISLLKKVKVDNPVMLLDEIDKMGSDFRGDPLSALLEVLDPEQNKHFVDHYLEVEYDLSKILFIATANSYNLPRALLDRVEIINVSGYTEEEKLHISKDYILNKQYKMHNIKNGEITIDESALLDLIRFYTKESGVRSLEREINALIRKSFKKILQDKNVNSINITHNDLPEYLGPHKYKFGVVKESNYIGATNGLAYTEYGGDLLTIEAISCLGKGKVKITGQLGDVMKESIQAAFSCFRVRSQQFGISYTDYKDLDIHIHVPEGAVPKDGPSAGIAIFTTIVSLMTKIPVKNTVAMTGEITLHGHVLPIGGLKEKLLAASRGGINTVIIPEGNNKDLSEIPLSIKNKLNIIPISTVDQILDIALTNTNFK